MSGGLEFKLNNLLTEVDISSRFRRSIIKIILLLAIASPAYSVVITCRFDDDEWSAIGFRYTCLVLAIQNQEIAEVTEIVGNHMEGRSHVDVKGFSSNGFNVFSTFPKGLERHFPNIEAIQILNNVFSVFSADLAAWPNLALFWVSNNRITYIDGDLFRHSTKLQRISFFGNLIVNVGANLLSNLNELNFADFRSNACIDTLAATAMSLESLKSQLITQCTPFGTEEPRTTTAVSSTTAEPGQCMARCSINEEADALREEADLLRREMNHQKALLEELQTRFREFETKPCSCQ